MLTPQFGDLFVRLSEFRNGRSPVTEDRLNLSRRAAFARDRKYLAHARGQWIGHGVWRGRDRKPQAPQVVVLIVVAVPSAVILFQIKIQNRSAFIRDRLFSNKDGLARLVAKSGAGVNSPRGFVLAVNREFDGTSHAPALARVVVYRFELAFGLVVIGRGADDLDFRDLLRIAGRRGLNLKLGQSAPAF